MGIEPITPILQGSVAPLEHVSPYGAVLQRGSDQDRTGDLSIFSRTLSLLSYRAILLDSLAFPGERVSIAALDTLTGFEPALTPFVQAALPYELQGDSNCRPSLHDIRAMLTP